MDDEPIKCDVCKLNDAKWECSFCREEQYFCDDCKQGHDWCMEYEDMQELTY